MYPEKERANQTEPRRIGNDMPLAGAVKPPSELDRECTDLNHATEYLLKVMNLLKDKLSPVTRNEPEKETVGEEAPRQMTNTQLGSFLSDRRMQVDRAIRIGEELLRKIEL